MVAKNFRLQGADALIMGSYHRGQFNTTILDKAAVWSKDGALPFILLGDFTDSASNITLTSWAQSVGAVVATPDAEATCNTSRREPSFLDFAVLSEYLFGLIQAFVVEKGVP